MTKMILNIAKMYALSEQQIKNSYYNMIALCVFKQCSWLSAKKNGPSPHKHNCKLRALVEHGNL